MRGIADDFGYAVRSLVRRPAVTVFGVLTIGLGVGAATAVFGTVESVLLNPLPYDAGDRMVSLLRRSPGQEIYLAPTPEQIEAWSAQTDVFEAVEPWTFRDMTLTGVGDAREVRAGLIRPSMHEMLGRPPLLGRTFEDAEMTGEGARVLLLGHDFWTTMYARSREVLGTTLTLDGEPWTVIGIMPPRSPLPGFGLVAVDVWRPLATELLEASSATALLREGVDPAAANTLLAALGTRDDTSTMTGEALPVAAQVGRGIEGSLGLLMGAVVLLLLIACVNVANLLLFRASARRLETAVRAALGGGRARLLRQHLVESTLLTLAGGALGIVLSYAGQVAILELRPARLDVLGHVGLDGAVLAFAVSISLAAGLVVGLVPALHARRPETLRALGAGVRTHGSVEGRRVLWTLVASEVGLSFALLLGSLTVLSALVEKQHIDVGYQADEVLVMQVTAPDWRYSTAEARRALFDEIRGGLARLPGAARVSEATAVPPRTGIMFGHLQVEGGEPSEETSILHGPGVDPDYFATLGQTVVRGRAFDEDDLVADDERVILGESTARMIFPDREAVGARFRVSRDQDWITVVGVAADVAMLGLSTTAKPLQMYYPFHPESSNATFLVRVDAGVGDLAELLPALRDVARAADSDVRIDELAVAESLMRDSLERERFITTIMGTFATLALVLSTIGLYGVVSQVVGQRTREIGIRIALGAHRRSIASMVFRSAGGATLAGILGGAALAIATQRWLRSGTFGLEASSPATFVLSAAGLALTALLAAYAPARRATRVDPVRAIRME